MDTSPLPQQFRAAGGYCGIKSDHTALDLALFVSDRPASAAGVFTRNRICGAPVTVTRQRVPAADARAVLINSGNANTCTGEQGIQDTHATTQAVAEELGCADEGVLACSTGIIGHPLPTDRFLSGIKPLVADLDSSPEAFRRAAKGMMTTDTVPKQSARLFERQTGSARIAGAAKGAAMIAPNMATMLAVIMTDAVLSPELADRLLRDAVDQTFNRISIDGHTSTSDTVLLLANGASGFDVAASEASVAGFHAELTEVCNELARAIVGDAEGGTHFITVRAAGLKNEADALRIARAVAASPLVKTAVAGADPNWGRIVSAAGYAEVPFKETSLSLAINGTQVYANGTPRPHDEAELSNKMRAERDIRLELTFTEGHASAEIFTSDLTTEYVRLNSEYTT